MLIKTDRYNFYQYYLLVYFTLPGIKMCTMKMEAQKFQTRETNNPYIKYTNNLYIFVYTGSNYIKPVKLNWFSG